MNPRHQGLADLSHGNQAAEILGGDGDVGNLPGNGCAGGDGNACIRLRQGRGVVDAVADHNHLASGRMLFPNECGLVFGQYLGMEFRYAHFLCHGLCGPVAVAGHHNNLAQAQFLELCNDLLGLLTQGVFNADNSGQGSAYGQVQMGILGRKGVELCLILGQYDAALVIKYKVMAADDDLFSIGLSVVFFVVIPERKRTGVSKARKHLKDDVSLH